jgi:hypothetical protein
MKLDSLIANMESASRDSRHSSTIAGGDFSGAEMAEAARQLRAAPDLLAALKACVAVLQAPIVGTNEGDDPEWYNQLDAAVARALPAIAKAEGRGA